MTPRKPTQLLVDYSLHIAIIILAIVCAIHKPLFIRNAPLDIIKRIGAYIFLALAMGCVLRIGEVDMSQGRIMGLVAVLVSMLLNGRFVREYSDVLPKAPQLVAIAFAGGLIIGALIGFINGWMVAKFKNPSWISTLAMQLILYGTMLTALDTPLYIFNRGSTISNLVPEIKDLVTKSVIIGRWAIPNYVWYAIGISILVWLLWNRTKFGKNMKALGENRTAAENAGINVSRTVILTFVIAGLLCGLAGFIECARLGGPGASAGSNAEIDSLIACLMGGFFLRGGKGSVLGLVVGLAFLQVASVALQWLSISANVVYIIKAGMLLWAAAASTHRYLRESHKAEAESTQQEGDAEYDSQETDPAAC